MKNEFNEMFQTLKEEYGIDKTDLVISNIAGLIGCIFVMRMRKSHGTKAGAKIMGYMLFVAVINTVLFTRRTERLVKEAKVETAGNIAAALNLPISFEDGMAFIGCTHADAQPSNLLPNGARFCHTCQNVVDTDNNVISTEHLDSEAIG